MSYVHSADRTSNMELKETKTPSAFDTPSSFFYSVSPEKSLFQDQISFLQSLARDIRSLNESGSQVRLESANTFLENVCCIPIPNSEGHLAPYKQSLHDTMIESLNFLKTEIKEINAIKPQEKEELLSLAVYEARLQEAVKLYQEYYSIIPGEETQSAIARQVLEETKPSPSVLRF